MKRTLAQMTDEELRRLLIAGLEARYGFEEADRRLEAMIKRMEKLFAEVGKTNDGHAFLALAAHIAFRTAIEDIRKKASN
jgi:hypothetical protein